MNKAIMACGATALLLTGCGQAPETGNTIVTDLAPPPVKPLEVGCLSEDGRSIAVGAIQKAVVKEVSSYAPPGEAQRVPAAVIRTAVERVPMEIADVRTTGQNDKTTKRSCSGMLRISLPADLVSKVNESLTTMERTTIEDVALQNNIEDDSGAYQIALDYTVQPTDDGQKIYAEVLDIQAVTAFMTKLVTADVYSGSIRYAQQAQQQREEAAQAERDAATRERDQAALAEATENKRLSVARFTQAWLSMPEYARERLRDMQRAWNRKRTADCKVEAANTYGTSDQMLTARYQCEARANYARAEQFDSVARQASTSEQDEQQ